MAKKPVQWNRPVRRMIGKNQNIPSLGTTYTSKCGRFTINQGHYASGRNGYFCDVAYNLVDNVEPKNNSQHETLREAKFCAYTSVDPNYDEDG